MKKTSGIQPVQEKHFGASPLVSLALTSFALQINVHFFIYLHPKRKRRRRKSQRMELWKLLWISAMNLLNSNKTVIFPTSRNPFDPSLFLFQFFFFFTFSLIFSSPLLCFSILPANQISVLTLVRQLTSFIFIFFSETKLVPK